MQRAEEVWAGEAGQFATLVSANALERFEDALLRLGDQERYASNHV